MIAQHTPGPWHSQLASQKTWNVGVYDASGTEVALIKVKSALHGQRRDADARLMAAAPDLLDALVDLDSRLRDCFALPGVADAYDSAYQESVSDAISKAVGAVK